MTDDHISALSRTRANLVGERRAYAEKLAADGERHDMERWRQIFVEIQTTIEVVDVAISDETRLLQEQA